MVRDEICSLTRGPSLDGGVGCENFLIGMAVSFGEAQRVSAAEVVHRRDEVSIWIARGPPVLTAFGTVGPYA